MRHYDKKNRFFDTFDPKTGYYFRSEILDGENQGKDPFMRDFPALMDIGIMGHCAHGQSGLCAKAGIQCYQNGLTVSAPNMKLEDYKRLVQEAGKKKCCQVALGGRGDPDMHEDFEEILKATVEAGMVPNFTTSGLGMTPEKAALCKKYCGAVAVSMYSRLDAPEIAWRADNAGRIYESMESIPVLFTLGNTNPDCKQVEDPAFGYQINGEFYGWDEPHHLSFGRRDRYKYFRVFNETQDPNYTFQAIQMLLDAGVTTNIHFVLSRSTLEEAVIRMKYGGFPKGINAVVFLLHKPVGQGTEAEMIDSEDPMFRQFLELVNNGCLRYRVGFDSCTVPALLKTCKNVDPVSLDGCEAARFSMYVSSDMIAMPCSFDNVEGRWGFDLEGRTIQEAWDSPQFEAFRNGMRNACPDCPDRETCCGGCQIRPESTPCGARDKKEETV